MVFNNYSLITLKPCDITEQNLFWKFKIEDIRASVRLYTYFTLSIWVISLLTLAVAQTKMSLINSLTASISTALWILIAFFSKRWDIYIYLLPVYRILVHSFFILNMSELDFSENECDNEAIY